MRGLTAAAPLVVLLLVSGCFDGCKEEPGAGRDPVAPTDARVDGPPAMSVGTLRGLGSHVWEASLDVRGDSKGNWASREVVAKMVWSELDLWDYEELVGDTAWGERQIDRDLYRRQSLGGRWLKSPAPAGNALILSRSLQLWVEATSGFGPQVAWRELGEDVLDGRPVRVMGLEIAPAPAPDTPVPMEPDLAARKMGIVTSAVELRGTVYIDLQTGNRLLAELEGRFVPRAVPGWDPTDEVLVTYQERRTLTSLPPTISPPPPEDIVTPRRRPVSAGGAP